MQRFFRYPLFLLLLFFLVTIFFVPHARKKKVDNNIEENVLKDHHLQNYYDFLADFGNDRILIGAFQFDTIDAELIRSLFSLEQQLMETKMVEEIVSPISVLRDVFRIETAASLEVWLQSEQRIAGYLSRIESFRAMSGTILNTKTSTASLLVKLNHSVSDTDIAGVEKLLQVMESAPAFKGRMQVTGIPEIVKVLHGYTQRDSRVFTPATMLLVLLILFLLYRSLFGVIVPLVAIVIPLIWTMGLHNYQGNSMNFITSMVPPLLLGIGLTGCIHFITSYYELARTKKEFTPEFVFQTIRELTPPLLLCQLTTAIGFFSLAANGLGAIQTYGFYAAIGVIFTLLTTIILIPAFILVTGAKTLRATNLMTAHRFFEWVSKVVILHRKRIIIVAVLLLLFGLFGISRLDMETSLLRYLPDNHTVISKIHDVEKNLYGIVPVHLVVETPTGDTLENSLLSRKIAMSMVKLQQHLLSIEELDSAISYVDLVQDYDRNFSGEADNIPPSAEEILEYLEFYLPVVPEGELPMNQRVAEFASYTSESLLWKFITRDFRRCQLTLRLKDVSSSRMVEIFSEISSSAKQILPKNCSSCLTGRAVLWARTSELLVRNEVENFFISLGFIDLVIMLYFRSVLVGLLAILPNVLPLVLLYGMMGFFGIPVNTVTGMLACVAIGISVDDTIHYLYTLKSKLASGLDEEAAIASTMRSKGASLIFTTLVISGGFSVLMLSEFVPTFHFGLLVTGTLFGALLFDLFLTPAMVLSFHPFSSKKNKK